MEVPDTILEVMIESLDSLDELCRADAEILEQMGVADAEAFLARADEYYQLLDGRCGEHVVENLRAGARLAATLIVGAWQQAGSPDPMFTPTPIVAEEVSPTPGPGNRESKPEQADQPGQPPVIEYVASKNSKVYHRSDCRHARRISPENLIRFANAQEAAESGKRPCRVCRPDKDEN